MKSGNWGQGIRRVTNIARIAQKAWKLKRTTGVEQEHARNALATLLADARGIPMKIGQLLATTSGEEAYKPLCEGITPWPLEVMLPVLEEGLGHPPDQLFSSIEPSTAAASLGQVHRATHRDGRSMAIKLQYPDIAGAIDAELRLIGLFPGLGPAKKWGFDLEGYKRELHTDLKRELDYLEEARTQAHFHQHIQLKGLKIPKVYMQWCSSQVLVQEWVEGVRLQEASGWPKKDRLQIAKTLLQTIFLSIFRHGLVHGDPHSGNYFFGRDADGNAQTLLLDFGSVLQIGKRPALALLKLLIIAREKQAEDPFPYFVELGYDPEKLSHIRAELPALCLLLFRPFLEDRAMNLRDWDLGTQIRTLLDEQRWWFRSAATPLQLFLVRTFQGLLIQLETLEVGLPWWPLLRHTLGIEFLEEVREFVPAPVEHSPSIVSTFAEFSRTLRVEIKEREKTLHKLSIPSAEITSLREFIPEDVREQLEREGVDIEQLEQTARETKTFPFDLFTLDKGDRVYRVWLE